MKIYLVRHGETDWNVQGIFQGREDIPLNEHGILQAKQCGRVLAESNFEAIITSPLSRAKETAKILAENIGIKNFIIEDNLIERDFGEVSGLTPDKRNELFPTEDFKDIEPWEVLCERMMDCIKKYADRYFDKNIIMISHGASINAALSVVSNGEYGTGKYRLKNACINIIKYKDSDFSIDLYNANEDDYKIYLRGR